MVDEAGGHLDAAQLHLGAARDALADFFGMEVRGLPLDYAGQLRKAGRIAVSDKIEQ